MSEEKEGAPVREIIEIPLYTEEAPEEASAEPQGENNPRFETDIPTLLERLRQKAEREGRDAAAEDSGADDFEEDTEEGEANASFSIASLGNAFAKMLQKQKQNSTSGSRAHKGVLLTLRCGKSKRVPMRQPPMVS